ENDIYVGRLTGLVHFVKTTNGHTIESMRSKHSSLSSGITCITNRNDEIIIGTNNAGITIINDDKLTNINTDDGLASNQINQIYVDDYNNIWVTTNEGVSFIDENFNIKNLNKFNGLKS